MTPEELQNCLYERLPLTRAMRLTVMKVAPEEVWLAAPLEPNLNHHETVFGGSAATLAITAAWSLVYARLQDAGIGSDLVIQRNTMEYQRPMRDAFTARAFLEDANAWPGFMRMVMRKGRARILVRAVLECAGEVTGNFSGEFVALANR